MIEILAHEAVVNAVIDKPGYDVRVPVRIDGSLMKFATYVPKRALNPLEPQTREQVFQAILAIAIPDLTRQAELYLGGK